MINALNDSSPSVRITGAIVIRQLHDFLRSIPARRLEPGTRQDSETHAYRRTKHTGEVRNSDGSFSANRQQNCPRLLLEEGLSKLQALAGSIRSASVWDRRKRPFFLRFHAGLEEKFTLSLRWLTGGAWAEDNYRDNRKSKRLHHHPIQDRLPVETGETKVDIEAFVFRRSAPAFRAV